MVSTATQKDISSMTYDEINEELTQSLGLPKYRAKQIYSWLVRGAASFDEMTDLSKELRNNLANLYYISVATIENKLISRYDKTVKYLFSFADGECVESVIMKYKYGYTACISTQVGCKMGCTFCATGQGGFARNLSAGEMLAQLHAAQRDLNIRISHVVLMGMGEPLDNYDNVLRFLSLVSLGDKSPVENGLNIGMRNISLSTCGLTDKIYLLAKEKLQLTLSISLHAPNDDIRRKTMPVSKSYPMNELLAACKYYTRTTGRRIYFEYAMIRGVNDSDKCARELAEKLRHEVGSCHVNLIPINSVDGTGYSKSGRDRCATFIKILESCGLTATVRRTMGADINASCGQLRRRACAPQGHLFADKTR